MKLEKNMVNLKRILMKSKISFFSLFIFISLTVLSQSSYPLHPSVGDTIEVIEKLDYSLFPFVANPNFKYGVISFEDEKFYLNAVYNDTTSKHLLSKEAIIEAQKNIEKINAYYRLKAENDKKKDSSSYYANRPSGKAPVLFNDAMNEQIKKEARMYIRLQEDARRLKDQEDGIQPNQLRIEFR